MTTLIRETLLVIWKGNIMPPSGFSEKAVEGALVFIKGCYEDLLQEVRDGKHSSPEAAIEYEISQIGKALAKLHINKSGNLVERDTAHSTS